MADAFDNALAATTAGPYKAEGITDDSPFRIEPLRTVNDLPQYRPSRPIGHGETLPPHTTTSVPVQQRTGTDVMQGAPYQQIQYVVE
ncbi:hypothetical protein [Rhodococcus koreensis]